MSRRIMFMIGIVGLWGVIAAIWWLPVGNAAILPTTPVRADHQMVPPRSPTGLNPPSNLACLPFPQPTITDYNGNKVTGPYTSDAGQTTITWRDESDSEDGYRVQRSEDGNDWDDVTDLPADSTLYTDDNVTPDSTFYYRVGAQQGTTTMWREGCRKPSYLDSSGGHFRVFYRPYNNTTTECPDIETSDGDMESMCSSQETAQRMADTLELAYAWITTDWIQDPDTSFPNPVPNAPMPVDITLCDGNGCASSDGNGGSYIALRPTTMAVPFDLATNTGEHALRVPRHELFHKAQQGVHAGGDGDWVTEATARSTDDKYCLDTGCDLSLDNFAGSWYTGDVEDYLTSPNRTLFEVGYDAALFWTYISEQYGSLTDEPERGIDFFVQFWASGNAHDHSHGREVIDFTLADMGYEDVTFEDVFKNFVVANYVKDLPGAPEQYRYIDDDQAPGAYASVALTDDVALSLGTQYIADEAIAYVVPWGATYFRFTPDASVPTVDVKAATTTGNIVYFTLLGIKNGNIVEEINETGASLTETIANDALDEVVLVIAGLEQHSNFTLAVNATQPELRIQDPLAARPAQAGDPGAPEKIFVKVAVLASEGGTTISGIDPDSFTITVGTEVVPPDQIINSAYIQGEYWFLLRAPVQSAAGEYDLTVENDTVADGITLSDTETDAVIYDAAIESDNLIVGDRSGSMDDFPGKLEAAQDAARLYVDAWETGDQFGVVSYNDTAVINPGLAPWSSTQRDNAFEVINDWTANGGTGIGNALLDALDELVAEGDGSHPWHIFLISDGMETVEEPNIEDFITAYNARKDDGDQVPTVHALALGPDADQAAMQQLADDTGGTYEFAGEDSGFLQGGSTLLSLDLADIYRNVAETITLEQRVYAATGSLPYGPEVQEHTIHVDGSASQAIFTVKWDLNSTASDIELERPDGVIVPFTRNSPRHLQYRVATPMQGDWTVRLFYTPPGVTEEAPDAAGLQFDYLVEAALRSDLIMRAFLGLDPAERLSGRPMPILISLADTQPLRNATVTGTMVTPSGTSYPMTFFDDGLHGDGAANDGFYGNTFYHTSQSGTFVLTFNAAGTSPLHGSYMREGRATFYMSGGQDTDGDGLPDHWEEDTGLDPDTPNPTNSDPDGDGLLTFTEFQIGTHPLDPDTDNGGENDGSEVTRGHIPQNYPQDDGIRPPDGTGWPGAGQLWLTYTMPQGGPHIRIFRGLTAEGPFVQVEDDAGPALQWHDTDVENGTTYCYRLVAVSMQGAQSGTNETLCLTPQSDPIAPQGSIVINGDVPTAATPAATLTIRASDAPSDRHHVNEDAPPLEDGATVSGVAEMMVSNRADFAGATWVPYQSQLPWTLAPDGTLATVWIKFRDAAGNVSDASHDSIVIEEGPGGGGVVLYMPLIQRND